MTATAITALYDIDREKNGDGRSISDYLNWFKETLKLDINLVIYTEKKFYFKYPTHRRNTLL